MAVGPIAHGYLAFKFNALQTLSPEEETHDEKPQCKAKFELNDQYLHPICAYGYPGNELKSIDQLHHSPALSKGYPGTLLMPPEMN